jgi:hypothetical protein
VFIHACPDSPPIKLRASKLTARIIALTLCFALMLTTTPQARQQSVSVTENKPVQSRMLPPYADLPDIRAVEEEGKNPPPPKPPPPPLKPSTLCGHRDKACKNKKSKEKKTGLSLPPTGKQSDRLSADTARIQKGGEDWLKRLGRRVGSALSGVMASGLAALPARGHSFLAADSVRTTGATASAGFAKVAPMAAPPPSFSSLNEAKLDPHNRIGGAGEDLFSGNFHWSLPLVSLPGRNGLDLDITLHYNSLVWLRYSNVMAFEPDYYATLTPGFRLGFPELDGPHLVGGAEMYFAILPTGRRVGLRKVVTNRYEATDSSYLYLNVNPTAQTMTLHTPDGTQFGYTVPPNDWWYRCTQVKDSNGNYITINYTLLGVSPDFVAAIGSITDTLGRVVNFNYDANLHLQSITQQRGSLTYYFAQFDYGTKSVTPNFGSLLVDGPAGGEDIPVINRVITGDGARHTFVYNAWGQAEAIWRYGEADNQRAAMAYAFPGVGSPLSDCPRFTQRNDYAVNWAGANNNGWVSSYFYLEPNESYGQVTLPDGVAHKEFFDNSPTSGKRGLMTSVETWYGGQKKKWTTLTWASDSTSGLPLRPRVTEMNIYDDADGNGTADNHRRTTTDYTTLAGTVKLPRIVREYDADGQTVYRSTQTDYVTSANYTAHNRRIIGLPQAQYLYQGDAENGGTLVAQTGFGYDSAADGQVPLLQAHPSAPRQHDGAYGTGFIYRGNLTNVLRYSVTGGIAGAPIETKTGYYTTGTVALTRVKRDATTIIQTSISYDDSFYHYAEGSGGVLYPNPHTPSQPTYAYPTKVTDGDGFSSTVSYNYHFGGVTRTVDPKEFALNGANPTTMVVWVYDSRFRLERRVVRKDGAKHSHTRYVYGAGHNWYETWTTVNSLSEETYVQHYFDGAGREYLTNSQHPGSAGGLRSTYTVYDVMGRPVEWARPTEINSGWMPTGDDSLYVYTRQAYDWQWRPTVTYNEDYHPTQNPGSKREIMYTGCGCAGGQVVEYKGESVTNREGQPPVIQTGNRRSRTHYDSFGRPWKNETLNWNSTVYSSTTSTYSVLDQVSQVAETSGASGASRLTTSEYDGYGRLWKARRPEQTADTVYGYNLDDTINVVTDPRAATATYGYNNRGLVTTVSYAGAGTASAVSFGYDQSGRRTQMVESFGGGSLGQVDYIHDSLGLLRSETRSFAGLARTYRLEYDYNLAGQVKQLEYSTQPQTWADFTVDYQFDKTGRLTAVTGTPFAGETSFASNFQYRAWDAMKAMTFGQGGTVTASYNARQQLTEHKVMGVPLPGQTTPTMLWGSYQYYGDGLVRYAQDRLNGDFDRAFDYDHAGRTIEGTTGPEARDFINQTSGGQATGPYKLTYGWNEWGNQTSRTGRYWSQPVNTSPVWGSNGRKDGWGYDAGGNILFDGSNNYVYDAAGRNHSVTDSSGDMSEQWQDGSGQTIKRYSPFGYTRYYVRSTVLGGALIAELDGFGNRVKGFVYAGESRLAELSAATDGTLQAISWKPSDPVTGKMVSGEKFTNASGTWFTVVNESEPEPDGIDVGAYDPFTIGGSEIDPAIPALYIGDGGGGYNPNAPKFTLDGVAIPVEVGYSLLRFGAAWIDPKYNNSRTLAQAGIFGYWEQTDEVYRGKLVPLTDPDGRVTGYDRSYEFRTTTSFVITGIGAGLGLRAQQPGTRYRFGQVGQNQRIQKPPCEIATELLKNEKIRKELTEAFDRSNYGDLDKMHEEGGWVVSAGSNFGFYRVRGKTMAERQREGDVLDLYLKPEELNAALQVPYIGTPVAYYHTHPGIIGMKHPYKKIGGFDTNMAPQLPSGGDIQFAKDRKIPGFFVYKENSRYFGLGKGAIRIVAFDGNGVCK